MGYRLRVIGFVVCALCFVSTRAEYRVTLQEELNGNKRVTASVDGVKVNFTFDTGCSTLSLNAQIFEELVRKGVVKRSDLSEESESELANGETHLVRSFTIKRLQIGDCVLHNVRASVGVYDRPDADPLLGQSVLSRLERYTISGNILSFEPKPEAEQKALALAIEAHTDTSFAVNARVVEALRPYQDQLTPRYMIYFAKALEFTNHDEEAVEWYDKVLRSPQFIDEEGTIHKRKMSAMISVAEHLYQAQDFAACEVLLQEIVKEAKKEPTYDRGLRYAYSSLCYVYNQMENYAKEEQAILRYANYLLAPKTYEYLEHHKIEPNEDLAQLLNHISKYHAHKQNEEKAKQYERMAKNAGWKE